MSNSNELTLDEIREVEELYQRARKAFEERKKLHGSGYAIIEEVEDPSEKT